MYDLVTAFGLMLILEGLLYAIFPDFMRKATAQILALADNQIRITALITAFIGLVVVWAVRG
ncbi:MAG: DUF2065 domain-containing protein [Magnetovibrio sp.]|nr:DUF2065 domain-containing protein [Magnetovibrio sp.]